MRALAIAAALAAMPLDAGWETSAPGADDWRPAQVPGVFSAQPDPGAFQGERRSYRLRFTGPPSGRWRIAFGGVRRTATVSLNGQPIGASPDPFTPFALPATGLRHGAENELRVEVDNVLHGPTEAWWNWGGIVRAVRLEPIGRIDEVGWLSDVRCRRRCRPALVVEGVVAPGATPAEAELRLRLASGRTLRKRFPLPDAGRVRLRLPAPGAGLWSPARPRLHGARLIVRELGAVVQDERADVGLRSVAVRGGRLRLNGRPISPRGASIHEDLAGRGAALTDADLDLIVAELEELGAEITRAHYPLDERLLERLDRAGIMVWSQAPVWHRDRYENRLATPAQRRAALGEVRRTVMAARSHPSVVVHSVANELSPVVDRRPATRLFMRGAAREARRADPTLPVAIDVAGRPGFGRQRTYRAFDAIGVNQYFGWYPRSGPIRALGPYLRRMRRAYPEQALVVTEFGAEAIPELEHAAPDVRGGWAYQARFARRQLRVLDRLPFLSGALWWTLREFAIYPGWEGGISSGLRANHPNTIHNKGVITYDGRRKPAFEVLRRSFRGR